MSHTTTIVQGTEDGREACRWECTCGDAGATYYTTEVRYVRVDAREHVEALVVSDPEEDYWRAVSSYLEG